MKLLWLVLKKKIFIFIGFILITFNAFGQGVNNLWLLGYNSITDINTTSIRATLDFQSGALNIIPTNSKMRFDETEGNIADNNGNLLMSSNGIWIADATGDTMMNGNNLNPGPFASNFKKYGLPLPYGNLFLPWPGDTSKFVLFHMVGNLSLSATLAATELYYSLIDHNLAGGLGGVTLKNQIVFQDTLTWGIGACKHANGRDWWIVTIKDNSNELVKVLLTPNGISSITAQTIATLNSYPGNNCQPVFSPDGKKFAFSTGHVVGASIVDEINYFDFDRCTGMFSDHQKLNTTDGSTT